MMEHKKYNLLFVLIIFLAGVFAYSNSFDCSFHFDDAKLFGSSFVQAGDTFADWMRLFPNRPVGVVTFYLNYYFHGLDVWGYHLVNLVIHLVNAFLVWWLVWLTLSTPAMRETEIGSHKTMMAFLTGLFFVTHPLATQSVTYIIQRFASLATLFYLLSLALFVSGKLWQGNRKVSWLLFGGAVLSALFGIRTKEFVFTLPFAIILYDFCFFKTSPWRWKWRDESLWVAFGILLAFIYWALGIVSLKSFHPVESGQGYAYPISMNEYFFTQFSVILTYIRLLIFPVGQNLDYDYPIAATFFQFRTIAGFSALLLLFAAGILLFKRYRLIAFGIFWFFLTLSVESSIMPISQNVIFEHRTYLPSVGFFIAVTGLIYYFFEGRYLKAAIVVLLIVASINVALTYERNKVWKSEYTLWADCLQKSPNKERSNENFGFALYNLGRFGEALYYYNRAIRISPNYAGVYNNRGAAYAGLGKYEAAIESYDTAIRLKPDDPIYYFNKAMAYRDLGRHEKAIEILNQAIQKKPDYIEAYNNKGAIFGSIGQYESAITAYNEVIRLSSHNDTGYYNRAIAHAALGLYEKAMADYRQVLRLRPDSADAYVNLGHLQVKLGRFQEAIESCSQAVQLRPRDPNGYYNRGEAYLKLGRYPLAIEDFSAAVRLQPGDYEAYYHRGTAYGKLGRAESEIADYSQALRLKPDYAQALNSRAVAHFRQDEMLSGCRDAQAACKLGACQTLEWAGSRRLCR